MKSSATIFPAKIKNLTFVKRVVNETVRLSYQFGLYQDSKGNQYMCKLWTGDSKSEDKRTILNEIAIYTAFEKIEPVTRRKLHTSFPDLSIPSLFTIYQSETLIYLVIEYTKGKFLSAGTSTKTSVTLYERICAYFQMMSESSAFIKAVPVSRTAVHFFILYHVSLLQIIVRFPKQWLLLVSTMPSVYWGFLLLFLSGKRTFTHRDIGGYNNVLVAKNFYSLIDFEISCIAHPTVEVANIVATRKQDKKFLTAFFNSDWYRQITRNWFEKAIFQSLLLYGALYNVAIGSVREVNASISLTKRALSL